MKRVFAVLGLALLVGCANGGNSDCPRKDKSCGKNLTSAETSVVEQKDAVQQAAPAVENVTPSK